MQTNTLKEEFGKRTFEGVTEKRALIESYLAKIGWELRHHGCDHWYFYNHKRQCTGMYLLFSETDGRICHEDKKYRYRMPSFSFYLSDLTITLLDENCVSFSGKKDKNIFILCPNYDKKKLNPRMPKKKKTLSNLDRLKEGV